MEPVLQILGPSVTVVVVREKIRGHWFYSARYGRRGDGLGDPIVGSGSFSVEATKDRARRFALRRAAEHYREQRAQKGQN